MKGERVCQQGLPSGRQIAKVGYVCGTVGTRFSARLTQLVVVRQRLS